MVGMLAGHRFGAMAAGQGIGGGGVLIGRGEGAPAPESALMTHLQRLSGERFAASLLADRLNAALARLRGVEVAQTSTDTQACKALRDMPVLHGLQDATAGLADNLRAIERAITELEAIV